MALPIWPPSGIRSVADAERLVRDFSTPRERALAAGAWLRMHALDPDLAEIAYGVAIARQQRGWWPISANVLWRECLLEQARRTPAAQVLDPASAVRIASSSADPETAQAAREWLVEYDACRAQGWDDHRARLWAAWRWNTLAPPATQALLALIQSRPELRRAFRRASLVRPRSGGHAAGW